MLIRLFVRLHTFIYRLTGGRLGGSWAKADVLLLTTVGRRSGRSRTTPLLYLPDGDAFVVVATNDGSPDHPQWYRNLQAHPHATVHVRSRKVRVVAEDAAGADRERLWPLLVAIYPNYERDQQRTDRELPVVMLRPR